MRGAACWIGLLVTALGCSGGKGASDADRPLTERQRDSVIGVSVPARQMPFRAISLCISSFMPASCAIDQMPASIARRAPSTVCTWPSTLSPAFAASAITSLISSTE